MSDYKTYPRQDAFETTLSQEMTAGALTCTVVLAPSFTLSGGNSVYVGIDYDNNLYEIRELTAISGTTLTFSATAFPLYEGGTGTQVGHSSGAKLIISHTWKTFADAAAAIATKMDKTGGTFTGEVNFSGTTIAGLKVNSLTTAQRDALASPANGQIIYNSDTGVLNQYITGAWTTFASGTTSNASTTVAGKVEIATQSEFDAGTSTGGTGALLSPTPDVVQAGIQKGSATYIATAGGTTAYTATFVPAITAYTTGMTLRINMNATNTGASTLNVNGLGAKTIKKGGADVASGDLLINQIYEILYDGTNLELQSVNGFTPAKGSIVVGSAASKPSSVAVGANGTKLTADSTTASGVAWVIPYATGQSSRTSGAGTGTQTIAHGLGVTPKFIEIYFVQANGNNNSFVNGLGSATAVGNDTCTISFPSNSTNSATGQYSSIIQVVNFSASDTGKAVMSAIDATNITLNWTTAVTATVNFQWKAFA